MKNLLQTLYLTAALIGVTPAQADSTTWMCRDDHHHKMYQATLYYGIANGDSDCDDASCTITFRGTAYRNVKQVEGCKTEYAGTDHDVTVDLCTATRGYAILKVGNTEYNCQMR